MIFGLGLQTVLRPAETTVETVVLSLLVFLWACPFHQSTAPEVVDDLSVEKVVALALRCQFDTTGRSQMEQQGGREPAGNFPVGEWGLGLRC